MMAQAMSSISRRTSSPSGARHGERGSTGVSFQSCPTGMTQGGLAVESPGRVP